MKFIIHTLSLIIFVIAFSCRTKDGAPGPAAESDMIQQGSINGTLSYTDTNDKPVSYAFDYQNYFTNLNDNSFTYDLSEGDTIGYSVRFSRYTSIDSYNNYVEINFDGGIEDGKIVEPERIYFNINLIRENGSKLYVYKTDYYGGHFFTENQADGRSVFEMENYSFNGKTGVLKFDYTLTIASTDEVDSDYAHDFKTTPIIKGSVSVDLKHVRYNPNLD